MVGSLFSKSAFEDNLQRQLSLQTRRLLARIPERPLSSLLALFLGQRGRRRDKSRSGPRRFGRIHEFQGGGFFLARLAPERALMQVPGPAARATRHVSWQWLEAINVIEGAAGIARRWAAP